MKVLPSQRLRMVLRVLLGPREEHLLGDLDEEFSRRFPRQGRLWGEVWYMRESVSLGMAVLRARVRDFVPSDPRRGGMGGWGLDIRQAVRSLARQPGTTLVIGLTVAVAVGATTSIGAVADATFLRSLPYPNADRLVAVYSGSRDDPAAATLISPLDLRDMRGYDAVVEDIGVWSVAESVHLTDGDEPRRLQAPRASSNLFGILGARPELGRFFTADEEVPGADDAVVLSHGLWIEAFGGDSAVVARSVMLDGARYRIVGVAPAEGVLPRDADVWRPLALGPEWYDVGRWGWQFLSAVAVLRRGVDPAVASSALTARLAESVPERVAQGQTRVVRTLYQERVGSSGTGVLLLVSAVGLLLAIACANVMNVVLARSEGRARELGLRRALGSGGPRLVRTVLLETGALAVFGGIGGLLLALAALGVLRSVDLQTMAHLGSLRMDGRVAALSLILTVATAAAFGAAPVLRALRADPQTVLQGSGTRAGLSRRARRTQEGLAVAQVALACTMLVGVGLSALTFTRLLQRDPGFRADGVLTATIELPANAYDGEAGTSFYGVLMDRVRGIPGVLEAGATQVLPVTGRQWTASIELVDPDPAVTDPDPGGNMRPIAPGYFETLDIPLLEGRALTAADNAGAAPVAVIDETLARRYWPNGSPVGRQVGIGALLTDRNATIVGVVGSVPDESLATPGNGNVYFSVLQRPVRRMTLVVRAGGDPTALAPALRAAVREADPRIPITEVSTLEARVRDSLNAPRWGVILLSVFGAVAVFLSAVGIYGVLAYAVARRSGEIGIRMALGAAPREVLGSVVGRAMRLWFVGSLMGIVGGLVVAGMLDRFVTGVHVDDPLPWAVTLVGLAVVAFVAALLPAARAVRVDPVVALRAE